MKKLFYFVLLIAELFVGAVLMRSLWEVLFFVPIAACAIVAGLLAWQIVRYFKTADLAAKKKSLRNIALIMLIPIAVFFVTYVAIAIAFIFAFA